MKEVRDRHGDLLEENDTVKVHLMRDDEHSYETAIVQACCSDDPDSEARLVLARDLQIIQLANIKEPEKYLEKIWKFEGVECTKTEFGYMKERFAEFAKELKLDES